MPRKRPLRLILAGFVACATAAAGLADTSSAGQPLSRAERKALIREGKLNECVTNTVDETSAQPVLVFHNHCDFPVNLLLCARVEDKPRGYYLIFLRSMSDARHRLRVGDGESYEYKYNSCTKPLCTPPEADC